MVDQAFTQSVASSCRVWIDPLARREVHYDVLLDNLAKSSQPSEWFDPGLPMLESLPVKEGGRAAAWFIRLGDTDAVLRQYRRGGMAAHFFRDQYVWQGAQSARSFAEFSLLQAMLKMGLPVPRPLAAMVQRKGLIYRAALITQRIPAAHPLLSFTDPEVWSNAGQVIARMHDAGVWHADLNVFNILVDATRKVWLIDFDRSRRIKMNSGLRTENISRLLRSVRKVAAPLEATCWSALTAGYQQSWQSLNPESK